MKYKYYTCRKQFTYDIQAIQPIINIETDIEKERINIETDIEKKSQIILYIENFD